MSDVKISAGIALDGEADFRKAITAINSQAKILSNNMKTVTNTFSSNSNSVEALTAKDKILTKQVETQKEKVEDLKTIIGKCTTEYGENDTKTTKWKVTLSQAEATLSGFESELKDNNQYLSEAKSNFNNTSSSIDEYGNKVTSAKNNTSTFGDMLKANLTSEAIISGVKNLANAMKQVAEQCVGLAKSVISTGSEFESSMSQVEAVSGATAEQMEELTAKAKEMGSTTSFTASESADAFYYMGLAGWNASEMIDGISGVLNLAAAGGSDLATASDIVTDSLTAFGLSAQDATEFADEMAYAMSNSNTTTEELGEAYKNCASTAHSMGFSVEEVTSTLAVMANAGLKGAEAGSGLSTIMTRLATNTKECGDELASYGVNIYDAEGNTNSLTDILQGCASVWGTLTDEQQANLAKTIAGTNQYDKFTTIMAGLTDGTDEATTSFAEMAEGLANCNGTAQDMADTMLDNLEGNVTLFESALDGFKISLYENVDNPLKDVVSGATDSLTNLNDAFESGGFGGLASQLGTEMAKWTTELAKSLPSILASGKELISSFVSGMSESMPDILSSANEIVGTIGDGIVSNLPILADKALNTIESFGNGLADNLPMLVPKAVELVTSLAETIVNNLPAIAETGLKIIVGLVEGIMNSLPTLIAEVPKIINGIVDTLMNEGPNVLKAGLQIIVTLGLGLINALPTLVANAGSIASALLGIFYAVPAQILQIGINIAKAIGNGVASGASYLYDKASDLANNLKSKFEGIDWAGIGKNIIHGITSGVTSVASDLADSVKNAASNAVSSVKSALGIHSPSRVFKDQVGKFMAQGIGVGFTDEMSNVVNDMNDSIPTTLDSLNSDVSTYGASTNASAGTTTQTVNIYTQKLDKDNIEDICDVINKELGFAY